MLRTWTLLQLRTRARRWADIENDTHITDAEVDTYVLDAISSIWPKVLKLNPDTYRREETLTGAGSATFSLASDYHSTLGVDRVNSSGAILWRLERIQTQDRHRFSSAGSGDARGFEPLYNSSAPATSQLRLKPTPSTGATYRHTYLVSAPVLSADDSTIVLPGIAGKIATMDAAVQCMVKQQTDARTLIQLLGAATNELNELAEAAMAGEPGGIVDIYGGDCGDASDFGVTQA